MEIRKKVICPSCKRECRVIIGDAVGISPEKCPGCGSRLPVGMEKKAEKQSPGNSPPRLKK